jgi:membrane protein insertase, YidC/Oxa1 family, C-terminal domain
MKNRTKKIIGAAAVIFTLGLLTACNSFCGDQDSSSYRYGYDSINTSFFDSRIDALTYANTFVPSGYEKMSLNTTTRDKDGNEINVISSETFDGTNLYYIHPSTITLQALTASSDGTYATTSIVLGKNSFIQSLETTAKSSYINLPYNAFYEDLDGYTLDRIIKVAKENDDEVYGNVDKAKLTFEDIYGYTFEDLMTYKGDTSNNDLLQKILKGDDNGYVGRNNSLFVRYGYSKFYDSDSPAKQYSYIEKWNDEITKSNGANYAMNSDFLKIYESTLTSKISALKTCISITDNGLYGHISSDPLNETVPITNKAVGGFFAGWGNAFSQHGFLEGLLVYPIAYGVESLSHSFGMNGWGQIWAVLLITIIIRAIFMLITMPSTMSQQKMTYLQPEIAKLQQKYPNSTTNQYEKQRFAQAQMALYKKNKVHPFMSMLIIVFQFPLFICVWNALTGSASLSSDSVLGLYLSDTIWNVLSNVSGWPNLAGWWTALVLIILMSAAQIVSMLLPQMLNKRRMKDVKKTTASAAADQSQKQMKMMSWIMTAFVIFMGFTLPSAMGVYWFAGALFQIIQTFITQAIMNKTMKKKEGN